MARERLRKPKRRLSCPGASTRPDRSRSLPTGPPVAPGAPKGPKHPAATPSTLPQTRPAPARGTRSTLGRRSIGPQCRLASCRANFPCQQVRPSLLGPPRGARTPNLRLHPRQEPDQLAVAAADPPMSPREPSNDSTASLSGGGSSSGPHRLKKPRCGASGRRSPPHRRRLPRSRYPFDSRWPRPRPRRLPGELPRERPPSTGPPVAPRALPG